LAFCGWRARRQTAALARLIGAAYSEMKERAENGQI